MKKCNNQKGGQNSNNKQLAIGYTESTPKLDNVNTFVPIKRLPYDIVIFSMLCILGVVFRLVFARTSSDYATATIWGYGFTCLALFGLLISSFAIASKSQMSEGIIGFFKNMLPNALPIILTLVIVVMTIIQNISFYDQINSGKVADEFYSFSSVSTFLILVQICIVINFLIDKLKGNEKSKEKIMAALASEMSSIILILSIANFAFVGILQVILKYFSTDG